MTEAAENNKRIAKNTLLLYFRMLLTLCINLYTSRVVLDKLGVEDFGVYNIVGGVIFLFTFISSAMMASTQRFLNYSMGKNDEEGLRRVFSASLVIHIVFALIVIVLVETVGLWFVYYKLVIPEGRLSATLSAFHFSVFATAFLIISFPYNATIIAHERMGVFAYVSIFESASKLLIAFAIGWAAFDRLIFYAFLLMLHQLLLALIYRGYCIRHFRETRFRLAGIGRKLYREIVTFSGWNILGNIANVCLTQGTNILLNLFFGPAVNAAKGLSVQVQNAVNQFCTNFQTAQNPQIIKSYASGELQYMHSLVFRASRFSFYLSLVFSLPIIMKADWFLGIWLKDVPDYAAVFIQYTMLFNLIQSLANPLITGGMATGNIRLLMGVVATFLCLVIPFSYVALRMGYSPVSVFQIQLLLYIVAHVFRVWIVSRQIQFTWRTYTVEVLLPILLVCVLGFGIAVLMSFLFKEGNLNTIIFLIVTFLISIALIWQVGMRREERKAIAKFVIDKLKHNDKENS
ncbi:MAG: lipopolysaccharide biosynthesis protein [Prevotellaceae bacterium]|nr:lipopolysaccharide biosynthesis protein [Prevotellaceae bacterium]